MCIADLTYIVDADKTIHGGVIEMMVGDIPEGGYYASSSSFQAGNGAIASSSYSASSDGVAVAEAVEFSSPMAIEMIIF